MTSAADLAQSLEAIGSLLARLEEAADPPARACAQGVVRAVLDFHRAGLARCMDIAQQAGPAGAAVVDAWARDDLVSSVLALHGLHPAPIEARARAALDGACPNGWRVAAIEVRRDVVRVTVMRSGDPRRAADSARMRSWVLDAIGRAAPDADAVELVGDLASPEATGLFPVERLRSRRTAAGGAP
ncbi:MAG TPA: hypothetical protein VKU41_24505 [Polyangiaceae bacterium]|nr:hypothetical protein [Polyangiaceae bacterium]